MTRHLIAIDQGTTSSRAIVFRPNLTVAGLAQEEFPQIFPRSGWVEHDPEDLWRTTVTTLRAALDKAGVGADEIGAIGITNQRETVVIWDRASGRAIHNAIVWQDRAHGRYLRADARRGAGADDRGAHRPAARPVFLGDEGRLDP